jgi:hypothetical protein
MRLRFYHIVLGFLFLSFFSCTKELSYEGGTPLTGNPTPPDSTSTGPVSSKDTFYVTINGQKWVAPVITGNLLNGFPPSLAITGSSTGGAPAVAISFSADADPAGSPYTLGAGTNSGIYILTSTSVFLSTSGQLTILENNSTTKRVRGNFNFQATDPTGGSMQTQQLDAGYFSVQYQ